MNKHIEKIIEMSEGNPGVVEALKHIEAIDPKILNPLSLAMTLTQTEPCLIWIVYKDVCDFDADKAATYLRDWFSNCTDGLNNYIKTNNPEARGL